MVRRFGYDLLTRNLRRKFRRISWRGPWNPPAPDRPAVLYANHHAFYDAQILGYVIERVLRRHCIVWMEELDRFPFLAVLGARPFPANDPARRLRTIRETIRLMRDHPETMLIYFPEAHLHSADEGVLPFPPTTMPRLARVLPAVQWWPVALAVTGWHEERPTAVLTAGSTHARPTGEESAALTMLQTSLTERPSGGDRILLEGRPSPNERWDFSFLRRVFVR